MGGLAGRSLRGTVDSGWWVVASLEMSVVSGPLSVERGGFGAGPGVWTGIPASTAALAEESGAATLCEGEAGKVTTGRPAVSGPGVASDEWLPPSHEAMADEGGVALREGGRKVTIGVSVVSGSEVASDEWLVASGVSLRGGQRGKVTAAEFSLMIK